MNHPELLAPAGGPESALAALTYGADAVYAGLPKFSARAEAENFSTESLGEIVAYAHALPRPRKVYAAFNTLVLTRELGEAVRMLERLAEMRVDGVIVQDAGVARLARRHVPGLPLHASTQMAAHSVEGVRALARLGFTRVVLARELTLAEVSQIVREGGLEVEIFIHGTLCYAYSGLCLFSSHATGRSGNRGRCTYGCRTRFGCGGGETMPFSMKDLALGDRLGEVMRTGVASLKIEGRMKSPLYVAAVTDYYRRLLDGRLPPAERTRLEEDIQTIFSRPWTRLHAERRAPPEAIIDVETTGHRGARVGAVELVRKERDGDWLEFVCRRALEKHDGLQVDLPGLQRPFGFAVDALRSPAQRGTAIRIEAGPVAVLLPFGHPELPVGAPVYCASSQEVKRRYPVEAPRPGVYRCRHALQVHITLTPASLSLRGEADVPALGRVVAEELLAGPFTPARQPEGTPAAARKAFERLGDTEWLAGSVDVVDAHGLFVPASIWNEARRRLALAMSAALAGAREAWSAAVPLAMPVTRSDSEYWSLRLDDWPEGEWEGVDEFVLPLTIAAMHGSLARPIRVALPLLVRGETASAVCEHVRAGLQQGWRRWEIASLAGLEILRESAAEAGVPLGDLDLSADWSLSTLNPQAALAGEEYGVRHFVTSPEEDGGNLNDLVRTVGERAWVLLLQFSPLFLAATGPAGLAGQPSLRGRRGEHYVEFDDHDLHILTSTAPYALSQRLPELRAAGASGFRVDLTHAGAVGADAPALWRAARNGDSIPGHHEGNYVRGLL